MSKLVNYITTVPNITTSFTKEMLELNADDLVKVLSTRPLEIGDEKLYLQDFDGRSTFKLANKANYVNQVA